MQPLPCSRSDSDHGSVQKSFQATLHCGRSGVALRGRQAAQGVCVSKEAARQAAIQARLCDAAPVLAAYPRMHASLVVYLNRLYARDHGLRTKPNTK